MKALRGTLPELKSVFQVVKLTDGLPERNVATTLKIDPLPSNLRASIVSKVHRRSG